MGGALGTGKLQPLLHEVFGIHGDEFAVVPQASEVCGEHLKQSGARAGRRCRGGGGGGEGGGKGGGGEGGGDEAGVARPRVALGAAARAAAVTAAAVTAAATGPTHPRREGKGKDGRKSRST